MLTTKEKRFYFAYESNICEWRTISLLHISIICLAHFYVFLFYVELDVRRCESVLVYFKIDQHVITFAYFISWHTWEI